MGDSGKNSRLVYSRNTTETEEDQKKQQRMKLLRRKQAIAKTSNKPEKNEVNSSLKIAKGGEKP